MKDKAFARGVNREDVIQGAAELGVDLDAHIALLHRGDEEAGGGAGAGRAGRGDLNRKRAPASRPGPSAAADEGPGAPPMWFGQGTGIMATRPRRFPP